MADQTGFFAYPSVPPEIASTIKEAVEKANAASSQLTYKTWEHNDIAGLPLTQPILAGIEEAAVLVADITRLNFNVTYEIGYAIGLQRRVILVKDSAITGDDELVLKIGIFDTLGFLEYSNADELASILQHPINSTPLKIEAGQDIKAPAYLLETPVRSPEMTRIVTRVKRARLFYRSFTPSEDARLSAIDAIKHVSRSIGVLVPLLSPEFEDANIHNMRGAFVAGLAHGMEKVTLVIQDGRYSVPLDLRDVAETFMELDDINQLIEGFAGDVYEILQKTDAVASVPGSQLQQISLGDPMAENEFQNLATYYVQTDEYNRALRGEVNLVVGRKGTGKTALFFQVRDRIRRDKQNVVIDLKPEGYQLLKLKEQVLDLLSEGAKSHLITAFWEYLLLLEICRKVLEKDRPRSHYDDSIIEDYKALEKLHHCGFGATEGDFSERLLLLSQEIIDTFQEKYGTAEHSRLTTDEVTNLLHSTSIAELRESLAKYLEQKGQVLVLFDNLDKGWSLSGIGSGDILILRCLIDAARKVQREMRKADVQMSCIVFVRNDIYELLMRSTPDFGKEARASLDWTDPDLLREVIRRRLAQNLSGHLSFEQVWGLTCVSHYLGEETSQFLIDRSLMRPRNLLKLVGYCKSFAVNLDHQKIEIVDIEKGLRSYSNDLVIEADLELADVEPAARDLIYEFVGENPEISEEKLHLLLKNHGTTDEKLPMITDYLLYLGFLGVKLDQDKAHYIYDFGYDLRILKARHKKNTAQSPFLLNPAFWPALGIIPPV
jgi:hypothetical protein